MLLSVVITTYNRCELLKNAVNSTLTQQEVPDLELIIVDDGSTDETEQVVAALSSESRFPVKYIRKANGGRASACNVGIAHAIGEIVAFLDDDDRWSCAAFGDLEKMRVSQADFMYCPAIEVSRNGAEHLNHPVAAGCPELLALEYFKVPNIRVGSLFVRREVLHQVGRFDERLRYNEDVDLLLRLTWYCKACYSSHPTSRIYQHSGNISNNYAAVLESLLQVYEDFLLAHRDVAAKLGSIAAARLGGIFNDLVEYLVLAGRLEDAARVAATRDYSVNLLARSALVLRSPVICRLGCRARAALGLPLRLLRTALPRLRQHSNARIAGCQGKRI